MKRNKLTMRDGSEPQDGELGSMFGPSADRLAVMANNFGSNLTSFEASIAERQTMAAAVAANFMQNIAHIYVGSVSEDVSKPIPSAEEVEADMRAEMDRFFPLMAEVTVAQGKRYREDVVRRMAAEAKRAPKN